MQVGTVLRGRWSIERALGEGGTASVYLARDLRLDRRVAIKASALSGDPASQQSIRWQIEREARLLAELHHPHIVQVLEYLDCGPDQYVIMEYIEGQNLEKLRLDVDADLSIGRVWRWAEQLLDALEYLHQHEPPIMFRDLKPANVMIDRDDRVRLVDFGIARRCEPGVPTASCLRGVGTPGYAPIEQYYGRGDDPRTDLYALGATLYALLTRQEPPPSVALLSGDATLPAPRALQPEVPEVLNDVVLQLMALKKEQRPGTVAEVRCSLNRPWQGATATTPTFADCEVTTPRLEAFTRPCCCRPDEPRSHCLDHALPFAEPFSVLFRGSQEAAQKVCDHGRRAGLASQLLYTHDATAPQDGRWMVILAHPLCRS